MLNFYIDGTPCAVKVACTVWSGGKSGEHSKDYLSLFIKAILDALNDVAYRDDSQICRVYFEKIYAEIPEIKVLIKNYEVG